MIPPAFADAGGRKWSRDPRASRTRSSGRECVPLADGHAHVGRAICASDLRRARGCPSRCELELGRGAGARAALLDAQSSACMGTSQRRSRAEARVDGRAAPRRPPPPLPLRSRSRVPPSDCRLLQLASNAVYRALCFGARDGRLLARGPARLIERAPRLARVLRDEARHLARAAAPARRGRRLGERSRRRRARPRRQLVRRAASPPAAAARSSRTQRVAAFKSIAAAADAALAAALRSACRSPAGGYGRAPQRTTSSRPRSAASASASPCGESGRIERRRAAARGAF